MHRTGMGNKVMNIWVLTHPQAGTAAGRLREALRPVAEQQPVKWFDSTAALDGHLRSRRGRCEPIAMVLLIDCQQRLLEILGLRELLDQHLKILILFDDTRRTVDMGLTLRPRFMTGVDQDFAEIAAVLAKLAAKINSIPISGGRKDEGSRKERRGDEPGSSGQGGQVSDLLAGR